MSGIALVLARRGVGVTGSDLKASRYSRALEREGIRVSIGHEAANLGDPKVVVVSSAIPESNPELALARERGIEVWPRAKMLAHLAEDRTTVAVAGTHGKTSTSSMIATMLHRMDLAPTFLIGGEVDGLDTNAHAGSGPHYVVEADESDGSFVYLTPSVAVVTNIEADHLDHYAGGLAEIEAAFSEFMCRTPEDGTLVVCGEDARLVELAGRCGRTMLTYGEDGGHDVRFRITGRCGIGSGFDVKLPDGTVVSSSCAIPGRHMVLNACASMAVAYALGLDAKTAAEALGSFSGVRRRFDLIGEAAGVTVIDDYAHHPTEVAATLRAASELGFDRVVALFQPHRYSRTAALEGEFATAFDAADKVVMMDVYSAGEAPVPGVSGKSLVRSVLAARPRTQVAWLPHRGDVVGYLGSQLRPGDLVLTMGAGDVTAIGPELVRELERCAGGDRP
jgi:UDP-N-acetylmuramate--alanine ligase